MRSCISDPTATSPQVRGPSMALLPVELSKRRGAQSPKSWRKNEFVHIYIYMFNESPPLLPPTPKSKTFHIKLLRSPSDWSFHIFQCNSGCLQGAEDMILSRERSAIGCIIMSGDQQVHPVHPSLSSPYRSYLGT